MKILITILSVAALVGCNNLTPQQVQIVAATTAATVAIAGTGAQAFTNKPSDQAKIAAATQVAAQVATVVGQAAAQWSPAPAPTVVPHTTSP